MDNFFKTCPPKMSDGRLFTDFRTPVRREEYVKYINGIVRDDEYRLFLQQNAETILDQEFEYNKKTKSCWVNDCVHTYPTRVYPPWFAEERKNYDTLQMPNRKVFFPCTQNADYRATQTKGTKY